MLNGFSASHMLQLHNALMLEDNESVSEIIKILNKTTYPKSKDAFFFNLSTKYKVRIIKTALSF